MANSAALTSAKFAELLYPGLAKIWGSTYDNYKPIYREFFEIKKSKQAFERVQQVTGYPIAVKKDEGADITYKPRVQGYRTQFQNVGYALATAITHEMIEDDQYNEMAEAPRLLGESVRELEEIIAHNVLNNAFNASITGADGQPLCSTAHPLAGIPGATLPNTFSTSYDLTQAALEIAIQSLARWTDDTGKFKRFKGEELIVPAAALEFTAGKILKTQYAVGSADNDVNLLAMMNIKPIATPYLPAPSGSLANWFIKTNARNGLVMFEREKPSIDKHSDFDTMNELIRIYTRFSVGFVDWRCIWGSQSVTATA